MPELVTDYPAVTDWLSYKVASQGRSVATVEKYQGYIQRLISFLADSGTSLFDASRDQLIAFTGLHLHKSGLAPGSRKAVVAAVRGLYEFLHENGHIKEDPAGSLEYPSIGRRMPIAMQLSSVEKMLMQPDIGTLDGLRDAAIIALLAGCGMRVSGLVGMNESSLYSFQDGQGRDRFAVRLREKGDNERAVPLPQEAAVLLWAYLGHPELDAIDRTLPDGDKLIFVSFGNRAVPEHEYRGEHRRLSQKSVWRLLQKHAKAAGIPLDQAHPHALRHLLGTEMAESDATTLDMQAQLGHTDANATSIYVQVAMRKRTAVIDRSNPLGKINTPVSSLIDKLNKAGANA